MHAQQGNHACSGNRVGYSNMPAWYSLVSNIGFEAGLVWLPS